MLIPSHRHTDKDLELWREYEQADLIHGSSAGLMRKAKRAVERATEFALSGPCYAGVSWGKDSVVVADLLARSLGRSVPLVWVRLDQYFNPDCLAVRDAFLAMRDVDYHEIAVGNPKRGRLDSGALNEGFAEASRRFGERYLSGLRASESATRKLAAKRWGGATERTCWPISNWSTADVFGWLARHNLPAHPAYAMLGGGRWERKHLRVATIGGKRGTGIGRAEWEREYYSDILRRLESQR